MFWHYKYTQASNSDRSAFHNALWPPLLRVLNASLDNKTKIIWTMKTTRSRYANSFYKIKGLVPLRKKVLEFTKRIFVYLARKMSTHRRTWHTPILASRNLRTAEASSVKANDVVPSPNRLTSIYSQQKKKSAMSTKCNLCCRGYFPSCEQTLSEIQMVCICTQTSFTYCSLLLFPRIQFHWAQMSLAVLLSK